VSVKEASLSVESLVTADVNNRSH